VEHHPIESLMKTAMENLKEMVDVNKIVGDAVETPDGSVIIPISRVSFGFAAGGTEFKQRDRAPVVTVTLLDFPSEGAAAGRPGATGCFPGGGPRAGTPASGRLATPCSIG